MPHKWQWGSVQYQLPVKEALQLAVNYLLGLHRLRDILVFRQS